MISVRNLQKTFKLYRRPADRLKEILLRRPCHTRLEALRDITFDVRPGETLGVIGQNGAGKSTLLKVLTGVLLPDAGTVEVTGRITGLLELGTGFNLELSGSRNIHLNGTLLGMSREEVQRQYPVIVDFSELGAFIQEPIKTYSSGMLMRLAFAIAIHADPQVFVVDEALSVGDAYFQQKCMQKIRDFKRSGGGIIFVSHDMNAVKVLCDQALLLDHGSVVERGVPERVINTYNFLMARKIEGSGVRLAAPEGENKNYGNFKVQIESVALLSGAGIPAEVLQSGEPLKVEVGLRARTEVDALTVGLLIRDRFGQDVFGTNTHHLQMPVRMAGDDSCRVTFSIPELNLGPGKYTLTVAAHRSEVHFVECYQWVDAIRTFEIAGCVGKPFTGLIRLKAEAQVGYEH